MMQPIAVPNKYICYFLISGGAIARLPLLVVACLETLNIVGDKIHFFNLLRIKDKKR